MTLAASSSVEWELLAAQYKAEVLFEEIEKRGLIREGITERELSNQVYELALQLFGIRKYWHKRIVRAGVNTLCPYKGNPPNLTIQKNDLVFFDFGPVFEEWEADFGRTYLLGDDANKSKLVDDLEIVFNKCKGYFDEHRNITGSELYNHITECSKQQGWLYGGPHAGHLIGIFPHESSLGEGSENYICAENQMRMRDFDVNGNIRHWILEIHLVNVEQKYGGFYEELLTISRG
jgi:Xaa-Pro dipeptidase